MMVTVTRNQARAALKFGVLALALSGLLLACSEPLAGPEEQIRLWVTHGQIAVEEKDRGNLLEMISPAYADARGNERDDIEKMLWLYFLRQDNISLLTSIRQIRIIGGSAAEVELSVGMVGRNDGVLGFSADAYNFALELELDGDEWQLISARWSKLGKERH